MGFNSDIVFSFSFARMIIAHRQAGRRDRRLTGLGGLAIARRQGFLASAPVINLFER